MNLKPFNLERALAGDPVISGDGKKVLEMFVSKNESIKRPILALIEGSDNFLAYTRDGIGFFNNGIFMAPVTKTYYANVYKNYENIYIGYVCESLEEAKNMKNPVNFIKTISFELEE